MDYRGSTSLSSQSLSGTPSDEVPGVLATGRGLISSIFVSMCTRHPEGRDAEYLRWHTFDHRPEQHRLASVRGSLRLISTAECRAARAVNDGRYAAVDHVMTYFFADVAGLREFGDLAVALRVAGRIPYLLPSVERAVYHLDGRTAAPRVKVGADVLPWWPLRGAYLLVERGAAPASDLVNVPGVAGAWWGGNDPEAPESLGAAGGEPGPTEEIQITYCFLDDDPVSVAGRLTSALDARWQERPVVPLLAAPFYTVVGPDIDRYLPDESARDLG
jgi:hypothetical protein